MSLKNLKLAGVGGPRPVHPLEIFSRLTLRGSIDNVWQTQAEALEQWHKDRAAPDSVIQMNTGGGKTLVGLLVAQSLVNESRGKVLYVCPNNQLVEQTLAKAREIGLAPASRYGFEWNNRSAFDSAESFCVTHYTTVFNGFSVFKEMDLDGLVFDDAHVAEDHVRQAFTLRIKSDSHALKEIIQVLRRHLASGHAESQFQDIIDGRPHVILYVPGFITWREAKKLRSILSDSKIEEDTTNKYPWAHLKDHLAKCCFVLSGNALEISPPVLPVRGLSCFASKVRRVHLTATLPSKSSLARTFGLLSPSPIRPSGKSGEAQRMFVFLPGESDDEHRAKAIELSSALKSCVISPSRHRAEKWVPPSHLYEKEAGHKGIDTFAQAKPPSMLGFFARYDGIDLPGNACRVLVLDGLPTGEFLLQRFVDEAVRIEALRKAHQATRLVQAIGRIFRSNTDHGVVLLAGSDLHAWLRAPKNRAYFPALLQQQLLLGEELSKKADTGEVTWTELLDGVLRGTPDWDRLYRGNIEHFHTEIRQTDTEWYSDAVLGEWNAYWELWNGHSQKSAEAYQDLANRYESRDPRLAAWFRHWAAIGLLHANKPEPATLEFILAANERAELGRPPEDGKFPTGVDDKNLSVQSQTLDESYARYRSKFPQMFADIRKDLVYGPETAKAEEAMRTLGDLLGVKATRPDSNKTRSQRKGPDVLWTSLDGSVARGFELKTDKEEGGTYRKKEIGQCHNHEEWLDDKYETADRSLVIVGRLLRVESAASPSESLKVLDLEAVNDLVSRSEKLYERVSAESGMSPGIRFQRWLEYHGLTWPTCVDSLRNRLASDLLVGNESVATD